jgi:hypothetical protein
MASNIPNNSAQPRLESVGFPKLLELPPAGDEGFLSEIFAPSQIAAGVVRQCASERLMPRNQLPIRVPVAAEAKFH